MVRGLKAVRDFGFSVSATTRAPRPGEREGVHYRFVDLDEFARLRDAGELLEWAEYGGNWYGTPGDAVEDALTVGTDIVLDIENQGALQVKAAYPEAILIFILPPDRRTLEARLRGRADTDEETIRRRLAVADDQIAEARRTYDWLVTNDDVDSAVARIARILDVEERTP